MKKVVKKMSNNKIKFKQTKIKNPFTRETGFDAFFYLS